LFASSYHWNKKDIYRSFNSKQLVLLQREILERKRREKEFQIKLLGGKIKEVPSSVLIDKSSEDKMKIKERTAKMRGLNIKIHK